MFKLYLVELVLKKFCLIKSIYDKFLNKWNCILFFFYINLYVYFYFLFVVDIVKEFFFEVLVELLKFEWSDSIIIVSREFCSIIDVEVLLEKINYYIE